MTAQHIHPSQVRVGDVIGTARRAELQYTVKLISGPGDTKTVWTFFGRDADGRQHNSSFGQDDLVSRYAKG